MKDLKKLIEKELQREEGIRANIIVDFFLEDAFARSASDIHIDPYENHIVVRYRIDGLMYEIYQLPIFIHDEFIARIKVLSGLRIDEHILPQDGRCTYKSPTHDFDIRVSSMKTYFGTNAVLRLLQKKKNHASFSTIGMSSPEEKEILEALSQNSGCIIVTGPTGSGKTTTLYACLSKIAETHKNIISIEDPIEYALPGIRQIQIHHKAGMDFSRALRAVLRQDPDVIMVGEIRDEETARSAIHASLTGHLVLSTLHTNDACGVIPRLKEMGIEPYLISDTVRLIIAQRLVRLLCQTCKGTTCAQCHKGYLGRIGIYELYNPKNGHSISLFEKGKKLVEAGLTTLEEVTRVCQEEIEKE